MSAQRRAANTSLRQTQVRLIAESGIEYLRVMLFNEQYTILELGGLYDNPNEFCGHIVTDGTIGMTGAAASTQTTQGNVNPRDIGRFSVVAPALSEEGLLSGEYIRYGLEDESCKINLRWILQLDIQQPGYGRMILMRLPGVDEIVADSILDWIDDSSDEPREFGAKDEYYTLLDPPYYTRNGMIDSLDELLNVRGVTPKLFYGIDWNRNGIIDPGEPDINSLGEFGVYDGSLNLGLLSYLTLDSRESMYSPDGLPKINVNMEDMTQLRELLDQRAEDDTRWEPSWTDFIISFRQQARQIASNQSNAGTTENTDGTIKSLLEFIGVAGSPFADDPDAINEYGPVLYDNLTISDVPIVGRININQVSRTVLELWAAREDELTDTAALLAEESDTLLGTTLTQMNVWDIIDGILAERISDPYVINTESPEMNYTFWIYTHGIITDLSVMKQFEPYFCTQGAVFKATVVGRFDERSPTSRMEVWLDATVASPVVKGGKPARVIRVRDISELGPGYSAELLGADQFAR